MKILPDLSRRARHPLSWTRPGVIRGARTLASAGLLCAVLPAQGPLQVIYGISPTQYFGNAIVSFSDADGDGIEDFATAIPCDNQRGPLSGSVKIYTGMPAYERLNLLGSHAGDLFGSAIARLPDLNCDGYDELLVGAPGASQNGRSSGEALVFSGRDARILLRVPGAAPGDECGAAVCALGDLNGDGIAEFAIGSPGARKFGRNSGSVSVYDGSNLRVLFNFFGDAFGERFGTSLVGSGDMDGDGLPDLAVGAPCPLLDRPGYARVFSGADASVLYTFGGQHTWELFGASLAAAGDVDGDGRGDLLVGAPRARSGATAIADAIDHACGAASVFSGSSGQPLYTFAADQSEDLLGTSVALGPDLDGDGRADLLVGAPQRLRPRSGYVRAYSTRDGRTLGTWIGAGPGDEFGSSCAVLHSSQGAPLLAVGAPTTRNILPTDATRGASVGAIVLIRLESSRP